MNTLYLSAIHAKLMKIRNQVLVFVLLGLLLMSSYLSPIQADNKEGAEILNPTVQPATIRVGDTFAINATIVNNSNDTISVHNDCSGAFSVVFDNHAIVGPAKVCNWMAIQIILKPGENTTRSSSFSNLSYNATESGTANATLTISYIIANKTGSNLSFNGNPINVTKSFLFTISNQTAQPTPSIPSPMKQFKSGVAATDVKCKQGLQLVLKAEDGSPACVMSHTAMKLLDRGWAKNSS
jgi:hypothetical protein